MQNKQADLLEMSNDHASTPLADRMRPNSLHDFIGQTHLMGKGKPLQQVLSGGRPHSMILWGPPGVGKTTLARLLADSVHAQFLSISAVLSGVKEIRGAIEQAKHHFLLQQQSTILFVDEVHRFNKSQQDAFLPYIEDGTFIFIGATTENPSFELNNALLSRVRVYLLTSLTPDDLLKLLERVLSETKFGLAQQHIHIADEDKQHLVLAADGDARRLLNLLEIAANLLSDDTIDGDKTILGSEIISQVLSGSQRRFDKGGDLFYEQISAFHKSVRGSSADGALYWMSRMIEAGCEPLYIARRLLAIASEAIVAKSSCNFTPSPSL